jgi:putative OPT family oligopeptide transporter
MFGQDAVIYPSDGQTIGEIYAAEGASGIWSSYIRYIGAGALAAGGIISLIKSLPLIVKTFRDAVKSIGGSGNIAQDRTSAELNMKIVLGSIAVLTLAVWLIPAIPVSLIGAIIIVVFGFFFATVSSRMVGLVGSSNNPVSGMAIATLLIATLILKFTGASGASGMSAAIAIGSIICIVAAISGDTSQDLKTGYILGSTPKKQQIAELIGVVASALAIGITLYLLDDAWGFGSKELAAPQATLMKMIIEGVMNAELPWNLVFVGAFIAVIVELLGIPVLPFAIGVYLPIQLNACILVGGIIRFFVDKAKGDESEKKNKVNNGILFCSGMIAGEGLVGILLAILAIVGVNKALVISDNLNLPAAVSNAGTIVVLLIAIFAILKSSVWKKSKKD